MPFATPDYQAIRDAILRDIANQVPGANVAADGDYAIRANATGAAIEGLYQHQQWMIRQVFPDTADADYLEQHASRYGIARRPAALASGILRFSGLAGASVPLGTEAKSTAGVAYLTTTAAAIGGGGTVDVAAQAVAGGLAGNAAASTELTLSAAPAGVQSLASVVAMTGGADLEADASLLARLLLRIKLPPCGGAAHDYILWALEVPGVSAAYVHPLRRGVGTVDVVIVTAGGLPSAQLILDTQAHIDPLRPVTADALVLGPTAVPVDVTATLSLSGTTLLAATAAIEAALAVYFATLKPGDTVYRNRILALISETAGVLDCVLSAPAANVAILVDATHVELATLGTVALL